MTEDLDLCVVVACKPFSYSVDAVFPSLHHTPPLTTSHNQIQLKLEIFQKAWPQVVKGLCFLHLKKIKQQQQILCIRVACSLGASKK